MSDIGILLIKDDYHIIQQGKEKIMVYQKTQDLLDLTAWLQAEQEGISIQDIMDRYHVSKRTAIRMKDIIKSEFPQMASKLGAKNVKLWYIPQGFQNKYISFSLDEVSALQSAIKALSPKRQEEAENLENILNKIKASMSIESLNRIEPDAEALLEAEGYAFRPGPKITVNKEFMEKLRHAIIACKKIKIKYDSCRSGGWCEVLPYGFLYGNKHYLIAWHEKKNKMCTFNLNNISGIEVLNEYFERDKYFSLRKFNEQSFGVYQEEPFEVEWLFDKDVAAEAAKYVFHPKQDSHFNEDGTLTVKFTAGGAREMDWHLYTWGEHVKVIKPDDFAERKKWKE